MGALKMRTELLNVGSLLAKEARGMEEQPLYRSTVFETEDTGDYDRANCGERYLYDRIGAPNRDCLGGGDFQVGAGTGHSGVRRRDGSYLSGVSGFEPEGQPCGGEPGGLRGDH